MLQAASFDSHPQRFRSIAIDDRASNFHRTPCALRIDLDYAARERARIKPCQTAAVQSEPESSIAPVHNRRDAVVQKPFVRISWTSSDAKTAGKFIENTEAIVRACPQPAVSILCGAPRRRRWRGLSCSLRRAGIA